MHLNLSKLFKHVSCTFAVHIYMFIYVSMLVLLIMVINNLNNFFLSFTEDKMGFPMGQKGRDKRHGSRKRRIPVTHYAAVRIFFSSRSPVCQVFVSTQHHYSNNCVESLLQPYIQPTILKFENFFFFLLRSVRPSSRCL